MTKPQINFIDRTPPKNVKDVLNHYSYYINEAVNFGTNLLSWDNKDSLDKSPVSILLFRQFLDILDALSILVESGSSGSSKILLRSIYELNLFVHFISQKHTKERAIAYLVFDIFDHLKELDKLDTDLQPGIYIKNIISKEKWLKSFEHKHKVQEISDERNRLQELLKDPEFAVVLNEYDARKAELKFDKDKIKKLKWYCLFEGATNIESLSKKLEKQTLYELLYRNWSKSVHVMDIFDDKGTMLDAEHIFIHPIREPTGLMLISKYACNLAINTFAYFVSISHQPRLHEYQAWQTSFIDKYSDQLDHEYIKRTFKS